jgi:HK97 family phage major capsid protein
VQNDIANNVVMFGNFKRYRLFRRQGMQLAFAGPGDWQLLRENKQGFLARARYGGGLTLGAAFAKIADTQTT